MKKLIELVEHVVKLLHELWLVEDTIGANLETTVKQRLRERLKFVWSHFF